MKLELTKGEYVLLVEAIARTIASKLVENEVDTASQYNRLLNLIANNTKFIDEEKED